MKIQVPANTPTHRLDKFLKQSVPALSRGAMFTLLRKGRIFVNGERTREARKPLSPGDTVEIPEERNESGSGRRASMNAEILYEDDVLLVVNKPKGISVHPGDEKQELTLLDMLQTYGGDHAFMPQLVHRLDKYTSGVLVTVKTRNMAVEVGSVFRRKNSEEIRKFYTTIVFGSPGERGTVTTPLDGKTAITSYITLASRPWQKSRTSLLEVEIITGRTHQIRRHLAEQGFPVAGDDMYGNWELNKLFRKDFRYREYALHCRRMDLVHPLTQELLTFEAPNPKEILRLFESPGGGHHPPASDHYQ